MEGTVRSTARRGSALPAPLYFVWARRSKILMRLVLWPIMVVLAMPLVWGVSASLKTKKELYVALPAIIPESPTLANYAFVIQRMQDFGIFFRNSVFVTTGAVVLTVALASLAGYAFARMEFRGRDVLFYALVLSMFLPHAGRLMALYEEMSFLHLRNSLVGLILLFSGSLSVPIFIMRQTFYNLPRAFEDAALIDGCNRWQLFWLVMAPMATGGMLVIGLFHFIEMWGEYLVTLTMVDDRPLFTVAIGVAMLFTGDAAFAGDAEFTTYGAQSAGYLLAAAPSMVLFIAFQRWFVRGLMEGLKL